MDTLAGYIASLGVGAIGTYLSQFLRPKVKIRYWQSHSFMYTIPPNNPHALTISAPVAAAGNAPAPPAPANFLLLTQSLTIRNFGREKAAWVEIVHARKPDFFQLHPALDFTEHTSATGEHTLRIQSLAPGELFTIQFLCYTLPPALAFIRSEAGHASPMPWMTVRKYPKWVYTAFLLAIMIGAGFCLYWVAKGVIFVVRAIGA
jgi:hypothetical protein